MTKPYSEMARKVCDEHTGQFNLIEHKNSLVEAMAKALEEVANEHRQSTLEGDCERCDYEQWIKERKELISLRLRLARMEFALKKIATFQAITEDGLLQPNMEPDKEAQMALE